MKTTKFTIYTVCLLAMTLCWATLALAQENQPQEGTAAELIQAKEIPASELKKLGLTKDMVEKLDGHQLYSLLKRQNKRDTSMEDILIPSFFFLCVILVVGTVLYFRSRKDRQLHQTLQIMVDKGVEIPKELFMPKQRKNLDLRRGLILLALGIGFSLFLGITAIWEPHAVKGVGVGLVPALIGVGYLIVWKINNKNNNNGDIAS
jgi:hypothetical protein